MRYVDRALAEYWEAKGLDWRAQAFANLLERTDQNPGTHEFSRPDGKVYAIVMIHPDGLGPSRLLLKERLSPLFPEGYKVALPEMSCGLAFSSDADESELTKLKGIVDQCYRSGARPLAPGIYRPKDLLE